MISGNNGEGVRLINAGTSGNVVLGNLIGTNAAGTAGIGNGWGVFIHDSAANNTIGGTAAGAGNTIAYNTGDGVALNPAAGTGNGILGNAIFTNGELGIDLREDSVTANDGAKTAGPNLLMDFPVIQSAVLGGTTLSVSGYIGIAPNDIDFGGARVEFFKTPNAAGVNGEGQTYLGFLTATGNGNFSGSITVSGLAVGDRITATATDGSNNTSEFGVNHIVTPGVIVTPTSGLTTTEAAGTATFTLVLHSAPTANVTVALTSSDTTEGTLSTNSVTFTTVNWNVAQTVTITGVDDALADGSIGYTIVTGPAVSADPNFNGGTVPDVSASNSDTTPSEPARTVNEDTSLVFSAAGGNAVNVTDGTTANAMLRVQLTVTNGIFTLSQTTGLSFISGANGSSTMTVQGLESDINAALAGSTYTPTANYNGSANLQVTTTADVVAEYTFDNAGSLGADVTGNYNGTVSGASGVVDPTRGNVISMAGAGSVQATGHFGNPASVTLGAWVNLTAADTFGAEVISLGDSTGLRLDGGAGRGVRGFIYNGTDWQDMELRAVHRRDGLALRGFHLRQHQQGSKALFGRYRDRLDHFHGFHYVQPRCKQLHRRAWQWPNGVRLQRQDRRCTRLQPCAERRGDRGARGRCHCADDPERGDHGQPGQRRAQRHQPPAAETYTEDTARNLDRHRGERRRQRQRHRDADPVEPRGRQPEHRHLGAVTSTFIGGTGVWTACGRDRQRQHPPGRADLHPSGQLQRNFTIATSVSDGVAPAVTGSKAMTGIAVNDAPTATNLTAAETYTEDTAAQPDRHRRDRRRQRQRHRDA